MTHEQFRRMQLAACELMRLQSRGHEIDPLIVEWAQQVQRARWLAPPPQAAYQSEKIYEAMQAHRPSGLLASEIRARTGLDAKVCAVTLCYMAKHQQIAMLKIPGRSRFFLTRSAMEQGRRIVEAEEEERRLAKVEPKRVPRPAAPPPAHVRPSVPKALPRRAPIEMNARPKEQGVYRPEMLPANVRIEVLPPFRDPRYEVVPPVQGIGAMQEWRQRTAPLKRRRK